MQQASQAGPLALVKLLQTKQRKVVACALANKMARIGWALMMRQEDFRSRRHDQPCPDLGESGAVLPTEQVRGLKAYALKTAARGATRQLGRDKETAR